MLSELLKSAQDLHSRDVTSEANLAAITEICITGDVMTVPYERTRALVHTKELLQQLLDPKLTPRVPAWLRREAESLLRHYPTYANLDLVHGALPEWFGPAPRFSRLSRSSTTQGVIDATKDDSK